MADCKTNGWILRGVPANIEQLSMLKELYLQPSLLLILDMAEEKVLDKFAFRRIDPVSLKAYDYRKVTDLAMKERLVQSPNETEAHVKK